MPHQTYTAYTLLGRYFIAGLPGMRRPFALKYCLMTFSFSRSMLRYHSRTAWLYSSWSFLLRSW